MLGMSFFRFGLPLIFLSLNQIVSLTQGLVTDVCFLSLLTWSLRIDVVLDKNQRKFVWKTWQFTLWLMVKALLFFFKVNYLKKGLASVSVSSV
jgi:hypothetical protein